MRQAGFIMTVLASALAMTPTARADDRAVLHGKELAQINCASCHAIGQTGASLHPDAPPFRTLSERFPADTIDEALLAGVWPRHEDMPHFGVTPVQAADIAAYIQTLQPETHGRRLVEINCAECHAIGRNDKSAHRDAPAFRMLSKRYPISALEEAFVEGILTGHPDMPEFVAEPEQVADIIAYIESIQEPDSE